MRHRIAALPLAAAFTALLAFVGGTDAAALLINNGLAPPNPENVINTTVDEAVYVRAGGCPVELSFCTGPPTTVEIAAGASLPLVDVYRSTVVMNGGYVSNGEANLDGRFTMDGGTAQSLEARSGEITMNGGSAASATVLGQGLLTMNGGSVNSIYEEFAGIDLNGGSVNQIRLVYIGGLFMTGGSVTGGIDVGAFDGLNARATILGGSVAGTIHVKQSQEVAIRGGAIDVDLVVDHLDSRVTIAGTNFAVDGIPIGSGPISAPAGTLTGTLLSGDPIDARFCQLSCSQSGFGGGLITLIPEPSTALLLASGLTGLAAARRRRTGSRRCGRTRGTA